MKPRHSCRNCNTELSFNQQKCPVCNVEIEWGYEIRVKQQNSKKSNRFPNRLNSTRIAIGLVGIIFISIILYVVKKSEPIVANQPQLTVPKNENVQKQVLNFQHRISANLSDTQLLLEYANFLMDNRMYEDAINQYRLYLKQSPKNVNARVDLGICYNEINNFTEAISQIEIALSYDPNHQLGHFNLGVICLRKGDVKRAKKEFEKTIALNPANAIGQRAKDFINQL